MTYPVNFQKKDGRGPLRASVGVGFSADDYQAEALETLDALLAGPLGGGLPAGELPAQFLIIRAALRQIRADLDLAWSLEGNDERIL